MSFVERALQKMQAGSRSPAVAEPARVFGRVVRESRRPEEIEHDAIATLPVNPERVVNVDRAALRESGLLPPEAQAREIADQYRAIKRPLLAAAFSPVEQGAPLPQVMMMASALPGDGKTFTCINLALSMSLEKDHTVLLVDGDVAKPHISQAFGVERERGLLDLLSDPALSVESVVMPTDVPRLYILPAGRQSEVATELLASERMQGILAALVALNPRGVVLVDSPPLLLTSEAQVLSTLAGQIALVVKAGVTLQQAVKDAIELVGEDPPRLRLILNQADTTGPLGYYYGHRYGYGYARPDGTSRSSSAENAGSPSGA